MAKKDYFGSGGDINIMKMLQMQMIKGMFKTPEEKEAQQLKLESLRDKTTEYRQRTSDMNDLVKLANTQEGLDSALIAFNKFDKENETWPGQWNEADDIIGATLDAKRNEMTKYQNALKQSQIYYDTGILSPEKIHSYDIDDFRDLSIEVRKIGEINDIIASGKGKFNYNIKDGQTNEMLSRDMISRLGTINSTLKGLAMTGKIPMELAELVIMGEPVASTINQNRGRIKGQILKNQSRLDFAKRIIARSGQAGGASVAIEDPSLKDVTYTDIDGTKKDVAPDFFSMYEKTVGKGKVTYDTGIVKNWIEQFEQRNTQLNTEFLKWSRSKYTTDIDLDKLIGDYSSSKDNTNSDIPDGSGKNNENINALGPNVAQVGSTKTMFASVDEMNKKLLGGTGKQILDSILTDVTGKNLDELKNSISNKDKSYFQRFFDDPVLKAQMEKNRLGFEGAKKAEYDARFNRKIKGAENYLSESLWKAMAKENKSKYKKLSVFKDSFRKEMKRQYDNLVKDTGYPGTYLAWLKGEIESAGMYMPIGMGGKLNQ